MNIKDFISEFEQVFPEHERYTEDCNGYIDPIPEIEGAASPKGMWLLNLAYSFLNQNEAYFEIGTYHGKNLVAALRYNDPRPIYVCDNFSQYTVNNPLENFSYNMHRCRLTNKVILFNSAFQDILTAKSIQHKVGAYYYNGPHDMGSQYDSIVLVEPVLANDAIVIISNWNDPPVRKGTYEAIEGSDNSWGLLYDLPARYKNDVEMWWNGMAVFSFNRRNGEKE
jgi:hypothetical protein